MSAADGSVSVYAKSILMAEAVPTRIPMPLSKSRDFIGRVDPELLKRLARKYVWWKTVDEALAAPERIIVQTMNMGDYADVQALAAQAGDDALKSVLVNAEAGQLDDRSWIYWHYRLGLADVDKVPPLPTRKTG